MSRFTSTKVINSRWRNNDFVGAAGSTHTFPDAFHEEFLVDWALQISDGSIVITETPTTGVIQMAALTVGDIVLTGTATGNFGAGGAAIIGTSPISVATAAGTSTVSLNASYQTAGTYITAVNGSAPITASTNSAGISTVSITASYATSTHLHDSDYVNVGGDTMSGQLHVSSATTTSTVGFGEIIVAKGTSYGSFTVNAADDHVHIRSKNPIEVLEQSGPTMQGIRARGLGVNSTHTYPTLIDDGITFGEDANLYRVSANALKTDDALEVVGTLTNGGTSVSLSTHTHAYQPAGTYVTAVNGTAPITASTDTAGIVTVGLSASYASSVHTHATSSITSGNFVATLAAGTGVTVTGADANAAAKTVSIGQAVETNSNVTFNNVNINGANSLWLSRITATAAQSLTNNTTTKLTFNTASATPDIDSYDPQGWFDNANDRITVGQAGFYNITANVGFATNATGRRLVQILVNGSDRGSVNVTAATAGTTLLTVSTNVYLVATDYVEVQALQQSGGALNTVSVTGAYPVLSVGRIGA